LITGASDGIGRQCAEELAATGVELIVHARSEAKLDGLIAALEQIPGHGPISGVAADLADLDQVRRMCAELSERCDRLDVLLNNAGVYLHEWIETPQGHEATWAINVLAPLLLSELLLPLLRAGEDGGRVIHVSSLAHKRGELHWDDFSLRSGFEGYRAYAQSKLALVMLGVEQARRLGPSGPVVVSLHPGVVSTKLLTEGFRMQGPDSLAAGAATSVYLATLPMSELREHAGEYFAAKQVARMSPVAQDPELGARLYEQLCASVGIAALPRPS
jgi:NAD(P)-dependent dehydrogenase (short-subunit alcohol dehydrogenase family)